ncbi:MAG: membrane protein insertion efficiency factor YidD [Holophagales bacterium]|nr:membrane protein insertion efficiency factor YidD [Holophagales bacterium]MXX63388.1 membrane protein insertion efficiency factor YidD [Holophagales bacterium]MYC10729.1 membrane protein insertion efficiency factor YidD [Holophagales bacterium]MYD23342.1 membrane protein insertion efficiency factor YidD [Holophagales bacterium]MYI34626.1 membrane protein insertion efficiency factor YidD [Holophagales bacterium]
MNPLVKLAVAMLRAYKRWLSPLLPRACRFSPTCSEYGQLALRSHGLIAGTWLTLGRLLRCQPLGRGGIDPPPPAARNLEPGAAEA